MSSNQYDRTDRFYNSQSWKRLRNWFIQQHPLCNLCAAPGQCVDHVQPRQLGGDSYAIGNLQTLCNSCHAKKRQAEGPLIGRFSEAVAGTPYAPPSNALPPPGNKFLDASNDPTTTENFLSGVGGVECLGESGQQRPPSSTRVGLSFDTGASPESNRFSCPVVAIWGPPCAGKLEYAFTLRNHGDVVIDRNLFWSTMTGQKLFSPQGPSTKFIEALYSSAIKALFAPSNTKRAIIIIDAPKPAHRSAWAAMGARLELVDRQQPMCEEIARTRPDSNFWLSLVSRWFRSCEYGN